MTTLLHEMHHFDLNFPGSIPSKQDRSPPIQPTLPKSSLVYILRVSRTRYTTGRLVSICKVLLRIQ